MNRDKGDHFSDEECLARFRSLFPQGFAAADVIAEIAPDGWDQSPLTAIFHPTLEQVYQEALASHENIQDLRRHQKRPAGKEQTSDPPPTFDHVRAQFQETPVDAAREVAELVGRCLWDIFSDNHAVISEDGRVFDLGSFRGTGGFIADELNRQLGVSSFDYLDFYMGTSWIRCRADVAPVYEVIFKRLKCQRLDWQYSFPRLHLIDLQPLRDSIESSGQPEWAEYSPETALARESAERDRQQRLAETRKIMDEDHARFIEEARRGPPPKIVVAYQAVFGHLPSGWPPGGEYET